MAPIRRTAAALAVAASCLLPATVLAQARPPVARRPAAATPAAGAPCRVEGTWELVSVSVDGKARVLSGYQQRKMLANGRFMWLGQSARRDTIVMRTVADTLRAQQVMGGSGTYGVGPGRYSERLDYFYDPHGIGQTVPATCSVEGDWWTHSFTVPFDTTAAPGGKIQRIVEVWQRVP